MELKILHLYPDLMSLYGEWANVAILRRHLEDLGNTVTVEAVSFGGTVEVSGADFIFMGAGTERSQKAVLKHFRQFAPALSQTIAADVSGLFTGTAFALLGREITDAKGERFAGLGILDFAVQETDRRIVGDVYGPCALTTEPVVGFMNKCSHISGVTSPLLTRCDMGFGNDAANGPEGIVERNFMGTHLTGPVLVKNPGLLRTVVAAMYTRRGESLPEVWPAYPYEQQGYEISITELRKLGDKA